MLPLLVEIYLSKLYLYLLDTYQKRIDFSPEIFLWLKDIKNRYNMVIDHF
ncbi:hypothetical protein NIES25_27600 [Nostoc linckia NIES-25]|nr:hypothetical protein NIES25_27600 [Nostoc linckia NIES-25]